MLLTKKLCLIIEEDSTWKLLDRQANSRRFGSEPNYRISVQCLDIVTKTELKFNLNRIEKINLAGLVTGVRPPSSSRSSSRWCSPWAPCSVPTANSTLALDTADSVPNGVLSKICSPHEAHVRVVQLILHHPIIQVLHQVQVVQSYPVRRDPVSCDEEAAEQNEVGEGGDDDGVAWFTISSIYQSDSKFCNLPKCNLPVKQIFWQTFCFISAISELSSTKLSPPSVWDLKFKLINPSIANKLIGPINPLALHICT